MFLCCGSVINSISYIPVDSTVYTELLHLVLHPHFQHHNNVGTEKVAIPQLCGLDNALFDHILILKRNRVLLNHGNQFKIRNLATFCDGH